TAAAVGSAADHPDSLSRLAGRWQVRYRMVSETRPSMGHYLIAWVVHEACKHELRKARKGTETHVPGRIHQSRSDPVFFPWSFRGYRVLIFRPGLLRV